MGERVKRVMSYATEEDGERGEYWAKGMLLVLLPNEWGDHGELEVRLGDSITALSAGEAFSLGTWLVERSQEVPAPTPPTPESEAKP